TYRGFSAKEVKAGESEKPHRGSHIEQQPCAFDFMSPDRCVLTLIGIDGFLRANEIHLRDFEKPSAVFLTLSQHALDSLADEHETPFNPRRRRADSKKRISILLCIP